MKRKCVVFRAPCDAIIEEDEMGNVGAGDVLIETILTLMSTGTEMTCYTSNFPPTSAWARMAKYPFRPGYNNVGKVIATGEDVDVLSPGDVVFSWAPHCSHAILSREQVTKIPSGMEHRQAVFGTLGQIALNGVRLGEISLGDCVVVAGAGPVGQLALQCAKLSGAYPLVAMDLSSERLETALRHGADVAINPNEEDAKEALSKISKGRMADIVYDVTGNQEFTPQGLKLLKKRGKMVILGSPRGPIEVDFHNEVHTMGLRIIGAHNAMHTPVETPYYQWTLARDLELFFNLINSNRIEVADLISHTFSWRDAPKAYEMLLEKLTQTMCIIFDWTA